MNTTLLASAAVLGFLSFFEPCTIATHTLFAVRTNQENPGTRWRSLFQLILSRALLLSLIFGIAALIGLEILSAKLAMLILIVTGFIYLLTRKIYLPVPHLEFFRLLPKHEHLAQAYKLGLTLPACTLPLVMIIGMQCALTQRPAEAMLAGWVFALMFTLPTLWDSTHKLTALHLTFLGHAARLSPYITTLLLWSSALFILKAGI